MAPRAPEDGPTTAARATRLEQDPAQAIEDAQARANAMRDQATIGASRGAGAIRPTQKDPRAHLDAQAAARNASAAAAAAFVNQFADLTEGAMGDGAFDAEEDVEQDVEQEEEVDLRVRRASPARRAGPEFGGEADPAAAPSTPAEDEAEPARKAPRWRRVSPRRRLIQLDLERLLALGEAEGLLVGWQARTVEPRVLGLTSQHFHELKACVDSVDHDPGRIVLLKTLAANRHPTDVAAIAPRLQELGADGVRAWHGERESERASADREEAGEAPPIEILRRHYDPVATLGAEAPGLPCPDGLEEWRIPMWLKGCRREALELCAVAFHQAACDHLHPEWETSDGVGDPLMAALETHFGSHPAVGRWCTTLGARAEDHAGLWAAIDALRRARAAQ